MTVALVSVLGVAAFAQQPPGPPSDRGSRPERMGRRGRMEGHAKMRGREMGKMRLLRELDLTDTQKEQVRAAFQRNMEDTKTQREELRQLAEKRRQGTLAPEEVARAKTLREGLFNSIKGRHGALLAILTPEQKAKLEQLKKDRKTGHEEMRERRKEMRDRQSPPGNIQ